ISNALEKLRLLHNGEIAQRDLYSIRQKLRRDRTQFFWLHLEQAPAVNSSIALDVIRVERLQRIEQTLIKRGVLCQRILKRPFWIEQKVHIMRRGLGFVPEEPERLSAVAAPSHVGAKEGWGWPVFLGIPGSSPAGEVGLGDAGGFSRLQVFP